MNSIILVILIPFFTAMVLALLQGRPRLEKGVALASNLGLSAYVLWLLNLVDTEGIQVTMLSGYRAPYGIAFVLDRLACIMLCASMSVGTVALAYACCTITERQQQSFLLPFFQVVQLGVNWSFMTTDLFNLFVAYEVLLIGSYGCLIAGATRQQVRQTMMYIVINLVGAALFIVAIALVYALAGTLNLADLAQRTAAMTGSRAAMFSAASMVLLFVFLLKSAAFPLFSWLPDAYPVLPVGLNGYFAGVLTKVGIYSLLRVFVMAFRQEDQGVVAETLLFLSGFTMLLGVLGALAQWEMRRLLSWHIISQVGYMVMGVGLAADPRIAVAAVAATIFYVVHNIIVKSSLFLVTGIAEQLSGRIRIKDMGGLLNQAPVAAALFFVAALSIAGMPPLSGFLAKLSIFRAALAGEAFPIVTVAVITSFLTLMSMMKIWTYAFWGTPKAALPPGAPQPRWQGPAAATAVLVVITVLLGAGGQPFLRLASNAAEELVRPTAYVRAVLGERRISPPGPQLAGGEHP